MLAAPFAASALAQEPGRGRVIGLLLHIPDYRPRNLLARLKELGYVEGRNLRIELRYVSDTATIEEIDRAAAELVRSGAEVLFAQGAVRTVALHRATTKLPIVTGGVSNPVTLGLARSLRSPGMNVTGLSYGLEQAAVLQFGALRLLRPRLKRVVFVVPGPDAYGPLVTGGGKHAPEHVSAAAAAGLVLDHEYVNDMGGYEKAFGSIRDPVQEAAWVVDSPVMPAKQIAPLAIRHKLATHGLGTKTVQDGLLVCCGISHSNASGRVATIIDKILRGADPGTIPFQQPDRNDIALNRATAAAIGVTIPQELELRATEIFG